MLQCAFLNYYSISSTIPWDHTEEYFTTGLGPAGRRRLDKTLARCRTFTKIVVVKLEQTVRDRNREKEGGRKVLSVSCSTNIRRWSTFFSD